MKRTAETDAIDKIKKVVLGGDCIVFFGAGLSIPPGELWKESVKKIADRCRVDFDSENLPQVIDACFDANPSEYEKTFQEFFPKDIATSRPALNYIPRLPFKAFITTNFDPWVENHFRHEDINARYAYPDISMSKGLEQALYYIHGCYDSEKNNYEHHKLIFGQRAFKGAYGKESLLPGFLLNLFVYEKVLFIGFNPTERYLSELITYANTIQLEIKPKTSISKIFTKHILWPALNQKTGEQKEEYDEMIALFSALEIEPIIFDPKGDDFRGLEEILRGCVEHSDMKKRPAPFKSGFDI